MKMMRFAVKLLSSAALFSAAGWAQAGDPQLTTWLKVNSNRYAEIYKTDADKMDGQTSTTWGNGRNEQSEPAYSGVQAVFVSSQAIYVLSTGLASQVMGPWYIDPGRRREFPNLPTDQHVIWRIPRHPQEQDNYSFNHLGDIGVSVDGVALFDANDAFSYSNENGRDANPRARIGQGDRIWNRDAFVNEGITFDAALGHQQNWGTYHYHAEPIALRYLLGDHVDFDPATKTYSESKTPATKHSPILGWLRDGYPLYGPYGYSDPKNPNSGLRRMVSGFVPRDGTQGADNLQATGRRTLPAWAARESRRSAALAENQTGPNVSAEYPLGHYIEDYAYLGDLKKTGAKWDLDEFNGRWCVTPEFPHGTYAYFTTIDADGKPVYPYNMGRRFRGVPSGHMVRSIDEAVTTNFVAHTDYLAKAPPTRGNVTMRWRPGPDGGGYRQGPPEDRPDGPPPFGPP